MDFGWLWYVSIDSSIVTQRPLWWEMLIMNGEVVPVWGDGIYENFLYFLFNFAVNLKIALKNKVINLKNCYQPQWLSNFLDSKKLTLHHNSGGTQDYNKSFPKQHFLTAWDKHWYFKISLLFSLISFFKKCLSWPSNWILWATIESLPTVCKALTTRKRGWFNTRKKWEGWTQRIFHYTEYIFCILFYFFIEI